MPIPTMNRMVLSLLLPLALAPLGCDRDDDDADVAEQARAADAPDGGPAFGKHSPIDRLCGLVSCTDQQREAIAKLLPPKPKRDPADEAKIDAANQALADAFRSDSFSPAALVAWRTAAHDGEKKPRPSADMIVGIHGVLDATQRDTLADLLEAHGPGALLGRGPHGGRDKDKGKAGRGTRGAKDSRAQRFAAELCDRIDCSDEQTQAIVDALAKAKPSRERESDADAAFAAAFRGDTLDARTVTTYLAVLEGTHERDAAKRDAALVAVHRLLDAEQRAVLADEIADHGLRALLPERGHHGPGKRHHDDEPARAPA